MRQIRSATASNFVPMPPGRFHPHRHLRVPPRHGSARCVAGEGQSRSLERARRHDDEEMAAMAEEPKRDPVRSLSNRIFLTTRESGFGRTPSCGTWAAPRAGSTAIRSSPIRSETGSSSLSSTAPSRTGSATSWPLADSRSRPRAATTRWNGPRSSRPHRRSEEHTSELQSRRDLVCRLLLEKKKKKPNCYLPLKKKKTKKHENNK